jgi:hypothetical protein
VSRAPPTSFQFKSREPVITLPPPPWALFRASEPAGHLERYAELLAAMGNILMTVQTRCHVWLGMIDGSRFSCVTLNPSSSAGYPRGALPPPELVPVPDTTV